MENAIELIKKALNEKSFTYKVPHWYRCFSHYQEVAVFDLGNAIRDDIAQHTTYRVRRILNSIGLIPLLTSEQITPIFKMSRGDELAFLWFIMEMYYKSEENEEDDLTCTPPEWYNSNEQLLMSMMFYLDFYPTLRMLDRILPMGHPTPKKNMAAKKNSGCCKQTEDEKQKHKNLRRRQYKLPYFQPLVEPRPYGTSLKLKRPPRKAKITEIPQTEPKANFRWFGKYQVNDPNNHKAHIVSDQINKIVDGLTLDGVRNENVKFLTDSHRLIAKAEQSLADEFKVITRDKLLRYFDVNAKAREARQKRIVEQLEEASAFYQERFRILALKHRILTTRKELFGRSQTEPPPAFIYLSGRSEQGSDHTRLTGGAQKRRKSKTRKKRNQKKVITEEPAPLPPPKPIKLKTNMCYETDSKDIENFELPVYECKSGIKYVPVINESLCSICKDIDKNDFIKICEEPITAKCPYCRRHNIQKTIKIHSVDSDAENSPSKERVKHCDGPRKRESINEIEFFKMPNSNEANPCHFNFGQLFSDKTNRGKEQFIKAEFIRNVDNNIVRLNQLLDINYDQGLAAAAEENAAKITLSDFNFYNREYENLDQKTREFKERLDFGKNVYDPNDEDLMTEMLRLALEKLQENHSYVLPTLPKVWLVPPLQEWIRQRYGKKYSHQERINLVNKSKSAMNSLLSLLFKRTVPTPEMADKIYHMVPYSQRPYLMEQAQKIRNDYLYRLSHIIMETGRHFLMAMRPQLCNSTPIKSFYAYMPANLHDLNFSIHRNAKMGIGSKSPTATQEKQI